MDRLCRANKGRVEMNRRIGFVLAFVALAGLSAPTVYGGASAAYNACLNACMKNYPAGPKRARCVADCTAALAAKSTVASEAVPINLRMECGGDGSYCGKWSAATYQIRILRAVDDNAAYTLKALTNDLSTPTSVSFWLVDDDHPDFDGEDFDGDEDPNDTLLLGTDTEGPEWSVTFTPSVLGLNPNWDGFIYADASVPGHTDADKDYIVALGRHGVVPAVSEWGLAVMVLMVLASATVIILRRRRVAA